MSPERAGVPTSVLGALGPIHVTQLVAPALAAVHQWVWSASVRERNGSCEGRCWDRGCFLWVRGGWYVGSGRGNPGIGMQTGNQRGDADTLIGRHTRSHTESHMPPCYTQAVHWDSTHSDTPRHTQSHVAGRTSHTCRVWPVCRSTATPGLHSVSYTPCDPWTEFHLQSCWGTQDAGALRLADTPIETPWTAAHPGTHGHRFHTWAHVARVSKCRHLLDCAHCSPLMGTCRQISHV